MTGNAGNSSLSEPPIREGGFTYHLFSYKEKLRCSTMRLLIVKRSTFVIILGPPVKFKIKV